MAADYRRGFKALAERLALEVRDGMGSDWQGRLDPRALAKHVGVVVFDLPEMRRLGMKEESLRFLLGRGRREFSAALFESDGVRVIVADPAPENRSMKRESSPVQPDPEDRCARPDTAKSRSSAS